MNLECRKHSKHFIELIFRDGLNNELVIVTVEEETAATSRAFASLEHHFAIELWTEALMKDL